MFIRTFTTWVLSIDGEAETMGTQSPLVDSSLKDFILPCGFTKTLLCLTVAVLSMLHDEGVLGSQAGYKADIFLTENPNIPKATQLLQGWQILQ